MRKSSILCLTLFLYIVVAVNHVPRGWRKITGDTRVWSGNPDGIAEDMPDGDRENSAVTAMAVFDKYLYIGVSRNEFYSPTDDFDTIYGKIAQLTGIPIEESKLFTIPEVLDMRARIFRMDLETKAWETFWISPLCTSGGDIQNMKQAMWTSITAMIAFKDGNLYIGTQAGDRAACGGEKSTTFVGAALLAVEPGAEKGSVTVIFSRVGSTKISALAAHGSQLFWTADDDEAKCRTGIFSSGPCKFPFSKPGIWSSVKPLRKYEAKGVPDTGNSGENPSAYFEKKALPPFLKNLRGEVNQMISEWGRLYFFITNFDWAKGGFWVIRLGPAPAEQSSRVSNQAKMNNAEEEEDKSFLERAAGWFPTLTVEWDMLVGDKAEGARYPPGMGLKYGGAAGIAKAYAFRGRIFVGTSSDFLLRMKFAKSPREVGLSMQPAQVWSFDSSERWTLHVGPAFYSTSNNGNAGSDWFIRAGSAGAGFDSPSNIGISGFGEFSGTLFATTINYRSLLMPLLSTDVLSKLLLRDFGTVESAGFDMWSTSNGFSWDRETDNGFSDTFNLAAPSLVNDNNAKVLYLGTSNFFFGAQLWARRDTERITDPGFVPQKPCLGLIREPDEIISSTFDRRGGDELFRYFDGRDHEASNCLSMFWEYWSGHEWKRGIHAGFDEWLFSAGPIPGEPMDICRVSHKFRDVSEYKKFTEATNTRYIRMTMVQGLGKNCQIVFELPKEAVFMTTPAEEKGMKPGIRRISNPSVLNAQQRVIPEPALHATWLFAIMSTSALLVVGAVLVVVIYKLWKKEPEQPARLEVTI